MGRNALFPHALNYLDEHLPAMSLDLDPTRDLSQTSSSPSAPDPVEALSQRSGVSTTALERLSPDDLNGMQRLEADVTRAAERPGRMPPEALRAVIEARDQIRASVAAREVPDGKVPAAPGSAAVLQEVAGPQDTRIRIRGNTITVDTDIEIYGSGASQEVADAFERQIQLDWGKNPETGQPWTYRDPVHGRTYTVAFDVDVRVHNSDDPVDGPNLLQRNLPFDRTNYIEVVDSWRARQVERTDERFKNGFVPHVQSGDEGIWNGANRGVLSTKAILEASHEYGHTIGFKDRYSERTVTVGDQEIRSTLPNVGYESSIMAALGGRVDRTMIDRLVEQHVARMNMSGRTSYDAGIDNEEGNHL